jgi:cation:H+ antiporter
MVPAVLVVVGLVLLTVASDQLVLGTGWLAMRFRVSPVVVGVVVIGLGTSAPEFLVSGLASVRGDAGLATGNLIGSNVLNLTLILAVAALVAPVTVRSTVIRREAPLTVAATILFAVAAAIGLGVVTGGVLLVATIASLVVLVVLARRGAEPDLPAEVVEFLEEQPGAQSVARPPSHGVLREVLRSAAGLGGTLLGAQLMVANAVTIAERLEVPQVVIGFTLVAIGTSLPELVTAVQAQRRGETDLLIGNLLGSNLFNSLAGGAIVGLATGVDAHRTGPDVLIGMVVVTLFSWALLFRGYRVSRVEAGLLLLAYLAVLPLLI